MENHAARASRPVDVVCALIDLAGIVACTWLIVQSVHLVRQAGGDGDGLEAVGIVIGGANLWFLIPALVCTVVGLRTDRCDALVAGRVLLMLTLMGGPFFLMALFP